MQLSEAASTWMMHHVEFDTYVCWPVQVVRSLQSSLNPLCLIHWVSLHLQQPPAIVGHVILQFGALTKESRAARNSPERQDESLAALNPTCTHADADGLFPAASAVIRLFSSGGIVGPGCIHQCTKAGSFGL